jgi:hypothetical protein
LPELPPSRRNRWYRIKWPGEVRLKPAWAEKYFDNHTEAFDYAEHPTGRVHRPVQSQEPPAAWVVLVEPE